MAMTRKLIVISTLVLITIVVGVLLWTNSAISRANNILDTILSEIGFSTETQAVKDTIVRAIQIMAEAKYTFDTSKLSTVYINDPRGGEITDEALAQIREVRQDATIQKDQVGILDYKEAVIENLKGQYDHYMADLRAKQEAGTLTEEERLILQVDTYGWPTPEPVDENLAALATQTCAQLIAEVESYREATAAVVTPEPDAGVPYPYPMPEHRQDPITCPTPTPTSELLPFQVPYRGNDPATLPPEAFEVDIESIEIEGNVARAVVRIGPVTTEYVLVNVNGQWYIAGTKLLKAEP
jgi:hypothetical protein